MDRQGGSGEGGFHIPVYSGFRPQLPAWHAPSLIQCGDLRAVKKGDVKLCRRDAARAILAREGGGERAKLVHVRRKSRK